MVSDVGDGLFSPDGRRGHSLLVKWERDGGTEKAKTRSRAANGKTSTCLARDFGVFFQEPGIS